MSTVERQIAERLSRYTEGVPVTSTDLDRMQRNVRRRLERPHRPRGRLLVVAAAALLVVAVVIGGAWWVRRSPAPVPAVPQPTGAFPGLWKFTNANTSTLFVIKAGGTPTEYTVIEYLDGQALVRHLTAGPGRVTNDGQRIRVYFTNGQGQPCQTEQSIVSQSDGFIAQGQQTLTGPGCDAMTQPESTLVRLSPTSAATRDLPASAGEPAMAVTDPVQLDGVWLLQGTGLVLAVDERSGPAAYLMDDDGDIDSAPDARGAVSIKPGGEVILANAGCGDSTMGRAEVRGQGSLQTLTATVVADPCRLFDGRGPLVWIRVN
jgi:hypothetical protein